MQSPSPPIKKKKTSRVDKVLSYLKIIGKILRLSSLPFLFAGTASVVFAAIILIKAAEARGIPATVAAATNAPVFLQFGKVAAVAAVILLLAEAIDSFFTTKYTELKISQYVATVACCLCAFNFAFVISPEMENLLPQVSRIADIRASFDTLHTTSRLLFTGIIIFSWISLILPVFAEKNDQK